MSTAFPWGTVHPLRADLARDLRRRAIFECCKWDPQVEDVSTLASFALLLPAAVWQELAASAEALAEETLTLERALAARPDLHRGLGLPRSVRSALAQATPDDAQSLLRVMRFDFHPTPAGWRISEANTDVPGGYNEAAGLAALVAEQIPGAVLPDNPAERIAAAVASEVRPGRPVALVHATAYTDDRQVMVFLARHLQARAITAVLISPDHVRWREGRADIETDWFQGQPELLFRFFPAEWLPNLGRRSGWQHFFAGSSTPLCNPGTALFSQSKRAPLVWDTLNLPMAAWRRLLPETRDPREVPWRHNPAWVLKPALGRVGDMVGLPGVTSQRDWNSIRSSTFWHPGDWVAQRRFDSVPVQVGGEPWHICLGLYTVNGRAAGIYGRAAPQPLINHLARDLPVLIAQADPDPLRPSLRYESLSAV